MNSSYSTRTIYKGATGIIISSIALLLLLVAIGGMAYFFLPHDLEYIWRWNVIPHLFLYEEVIEIHTHIEGVVASVTEHGEEAIIEVKGDDGTTKSYRVPTKDIRVVEGDFTFPGDTLATDKQWRTGLLLQGLWVTLKASMLAMMLGCLIGVFGGVASHSALPPLRWIIVVSTEIIRGIPLLWHILIWYFLIGSRISAVLDASGLQSLPPLGFGILAIAFYSGATITTWIRDEMGMMSTNPSTRAESGHVIGLSHVLRTVVSVSPKLSEQCATILKDSSLLSLVAVNELTKVTRSAITQTLQPFELMLTGAALYFVVVFTFSKVFGIWSTRIAKRYAR